MRWTWLVCSVLVGCGPSSRPAGTSDGGAPIDGGLSPDGGEPALPLEEGWCARAAGGPRSTEPVAIGLSAAHARLRYFGAAPSNAFVDGALATAIAEAGGEVDARSVLAYARAIETVCVVPADDRPLGAASVTLEDGVARIVPGSGEVSIPAEARVIAIDLRDVPDAPGLEQAIDAAVSAAIAEPLPATTGSAQERNGLTDEVFAEASVYAARLVTIAIDGPAPMAASSRPVAFLIGDRVPPAGALAAARMRAARRAWLVGSELPVAIAESKRTAVGDVGLLVRVMDLRDGAERMADAIGADAPDLASLPEGEVPALPVDAGARDPVVVHRDFGELQTLAADEATVRAALLAAHGAAKLFFPYFETLGDNTDARLIETLALAEGSSSRRDARDVLRRFGAALEDGHGWVVDEDTSSAPAGSVPIMVDPTDGTPTVSRSYVDWLAPGDAIIEIDGESSTAWLDREIGRSYGATEGFRFVNAVMELTTYAVPATLRVRSVGGAERDVPVTPVPWTSLRDADLFSGSVRPHGWLGDLGAPDVYYFNLDGQHVASDAEIQTHLAAAASARGIVLDMRGHPASAGGTWDPYNFLQRVIRVPFDSPRYRVPTWIAAERGEDTHPYEASYSPIEVAPIYGGPAVLITDHQAVSFAEDFSMMIVGARRVRVVGRPTAGTTGSVTGMQLPGGFAFFLTGMEARWPDGSAFFGEGVVPDVLCTPTAADLAAGRDVFVEAAIATLASM